MDSSIKKLINKDQKLYVIGLDEDLTREGFASFASADVYSLPVVDSKGKVIGILDHADFTRFVIQLFTRSEDAPGLKVFSLLLLCAGCFPDKRRLLTS